MTRTNRAVPKSMTNRPWQMLAAAVLLLAGAALWRQSGSRGADCP